MFMITTIQNQRDAIDHYMKSNVDQVMGFEYDNLKGFEAFDLFLTLNEDFELEFVCAYLDQKNGIDTPYPNLPN